jgi:hypothetical protein
MTITIFALTMATSLMAAALISVRNSQPTAKQMNDHYPYQNWK